MNLDTLLSQLKDIRKSIGELQRLKSTRYENFITPVVEELNEVYQEEANLETQIHELALALYQQDPEHKKNVYPHIKERDVTKFEIVNEEFCKNWCIEHKLFLKVDEKALVTYLRSLKGVGVPQFVTVTIEPTITISTEL